MTHQVDNDLRRATINGSPGFMYTPGSLKAEGRREGVIDVALMRHKEGGEKGGKTGRWEGGRDGWREGGVRRMRGYSVKDGGKC